MLEFTVLEIIDTLSIDDYYKLSRDMTNLSLIGGKEAMAFPISKIKMQALAWQHLAKICKNFPQHLGQKICFLSLAVVAQVLRNNIYIYIYNTCMSILKKEMKRFIS